MHAYQNITFQDIDEKNDMSLQAHILRAFLSGAKFSKVTYQRIFIRAINLKNTIIVIEVYWNILCLLLIQDKAENVCAEQPLDLQGEISQQTPSNSYKIISYNLPLNNI